MFLGVRPCPHVWVVGERRQRRWLCNQYRCLLFFYWKNYSTWLFLWSSVFVFNRSADLMISQNPHARHDRWWSRRRPSALRSQVLWSQKIIFCIFRKQLFSKSIRKRNCEGMGSAIPIKLPESTFPHLGESVVSGRILLCRVLSSGQCVKRPFWSFSPSMITDF